MKHELPETLALFGWFVLASLLSVVAVLSFDGVESSLSDLAGWQASLVILGSILVGAVLLVWALRKGSKRLLGRLLVCLICFCFGSAIGRFGVLQGWSPWSIVGLSVIVCILYGWSCALMGAGRPMRLWQEFISNVVMMVVIAFGAGMLGQVLSPLWVLILLGLVGVYDAIAVWRLKSMQEMAVGLVSLGVVPAIVTRKRRVPKGKALGVALIGNGDVLFVGLVAGIFFKSTPYGWPVFAGMLVSVWSLLVFSSPRRFYPAIPFILAGALLGLLSGVLFL